MITHADIENMSREEKLRAMEALWQEISKEDPAPESPAWHAEVLEFLMRQYFRTIPEAMSDAARMDGCNEFRLWWSIMLPLAKPALGVVALLSFQLAWNDFFQPLIYINRPELRTMALGLYSLKAMPGEITFYNQLMAVTMVMLLPMIILFLIFQKHFLRGIVIGAIKG
jgi:multiple sugar transport system permease protein